MSQDLQKRLGEYLSKREVASLELKKRYGECDSRRHLNPVEEKNLCDYCFRHLNYETSQSDEYRDKTRGKLNAPIVMEKMKQEVGRQKFLDWLGGLDKLIAD